MIEFQTVVVNPPPITWEVIKSIVQIAVIPFCVYILKVIKDLEKKMIIVETILIGADGKNGIRSRVRRIERRLFDEPEDDEEE